MPSGNCNLQKKKKVHIGQRWLTLHTRGGECQVGEVSEEGRGERLCPYMDRLGKTCRKQGPSPQTTRTILVGKTTTCVMKIGQFSPSACLLKATRVLRGIFSKLN